ncbi:MAG: tetratricopeptide repeat protein, partial [Parachlamydiaceae bacterium]
MDDKKEAFLLIDSVPRTAANIKFITWRASFYSEIDPEKAIKDIEIILQYRPTDAAQKLYLRILVNLGRGVEAARIYLSSKLELSKDLIEFMIRNLYCEGEYEWVISIYKKSKIEYSYEMLKLIGLACKLTNKFEEGIKVYKQLISLNPKDEQNYLDRALFFEALGHIIPAIYVMNEGLGVFPDNEWMKKYKDRLIARQSPNKTPETRVEKPKPAKPPAQIDPKKVTYLIQESTKKDSKREAIEKPKEDKGKKALQKANPHAVDPLKDPLADIKAIAKKGETQTGPKPAAISVPLPVAAAPKSEPPKPIVKVNLRA